MAKDNGQFNEYITKRELKRRFHIIDKRSDNWRKNQMLDQFCTLCGNFCKRNKVLWIDHDDTVNDSFIVCTCHENKG